VRARARARAYRKLLYIFINILFKTTYVELNLIGNLKN